MFQKYYIVFLTGLTYANYTCGQIKTVFQENDCCTKPSTAETAVIGIYTSPHCISVEDIDRAQKAWADALVSMGNAWMSERCPGALREANNALDAAYSFENPLLFKPTLTTPPYTFRPTRAGALSYFVGECAGNDRVGTDNGFALGHSVGDSQNNSTWQGFSSVQFLNMTYHVGGSYCTSAIAQGQMSYFSRYTQMTYTVDKTFAYIHNSMEGGIPLLTVHHSSIALQ